MTKDVKNMAVWIEFLLSAGLALFFHIGLHYPQVAYTIFGVGLLLSLATYLMRESIDQAEKILTRQYDQAHQITFSLAQIKDAECRAKADALLDATQKNLRLLLEGFIPLDETEYYLEATKCMDQAIGSAQAVDPLTPGWISRGVMLNLYQANQRALKRGVRISRIFAIKRDELRDAEVQELLGMQLRDGIDVRIIFRDEIPMASLAGTLGSTHSFDFTIYDGQTVIDTFLQPGKYHGKKTCSAAETARYRQLFALIEHSAVGVMLENDHVVVPRPAIQMALEAG